LTNEFKNKTIGADPDGYYYLRNLTKGKNIGNNTDEQLDFSNQNIYGPSSTKPYKIDGNTLVFSNRNYTRGDKLQVRFFNTLTDTILSGRSFVPILPV